MSSPTIFVCGATGTLGNALAHDLRKLGWNVHALVRNPEAPFAKGLAAAGVKLTLGDWDDEEAIAAAVEGCDGFFLNTTPDFTNPSAEEQQAKLILKLAKAAGVKHAIYSGVFLVDEKWNIPGYSPDSFLASMMGTKKVIEEETQGLGFDCWTILRPAGFMANWLLPKVLVYKGLVDKGVFNTALLPDTVIVHVDEHDLAAVAIAAFRDPAKYGGRTLNVGSDELTIEETLAALSQVSGRALKANYLSDEEVNAGIAKDPFLQGQFISRGLAKYVDLQGVRDSGIRLHTFKEYLERNKDLVQETYQKK